MRKRYTKPEIAFEDFSLSTSIAVGCDKIVNPQLYSCAVFYPGEGNIFLSNVDACEVKIKDGEWGDAFCYHVPTETTNMFTS